MSNVYTYNIIYKYYFILTSQNMYLYNILYVKKIHILYKTITTVEVIINYKLQIINIVK